MTNLVNIAAYLPKMAKDQPHTPAIRFPAGRDRNGRVKYTHYTFRQLDRESDWIARGWKNLAWAGAFEPHSWSNRASNSSP
jgi:acyl-CoA synthetase (AMP-forming)/AMP-acid ligase II